MRDFSVLSDVEFEELIGDLLEAEMGRPVARFAAGRDSGIDLRWDDGDGVAQCKHYLRSTFSQLYASAKKEVPKVQALNPSSYLLITSFDLTVGQKQEIFSLFAQWMKSPDDVVGGKDVDALLTRHVSVERRHAKLWISTGLQLFWAVHSDIANRSLALASRVQKSLSRYVVNAGYRRARQILEEHGACLISGPPGIGKTALAHMLIAEDVCSGFEPIEVSSDINEGWAALSTDGPQIFLYDDFLGQISFSERLAKNEDKRLAEFVEKVRVTPGKRLLLTTREYILRDARTTYERLAEIDSRFHLVLELRGYSKSAKAKILYNHLWESEVSRECLKEVATGGYREIIEHQGYTPRLIEYCTGVSFDINSPGYPDRFVDALDNPETIWRVAFEKHLSIDQRLLLIALSSLPVLVERTHLRDAHEALCVAMGVIWTESLHRDGLEVLEGTFISIHQDRLRRSTVNFSNPSVKEFVLARLYQDRRLLAAVLESAVFHDQFDVVLSHASGRGLWGRGGNEEYKKALADNSRRFVDGMNRTFNSPPIALQLTQPSGIISPDFEARVLLLLRVAKMWNIELNSLKGRVEFVVSRWGAWEGRKAEADDLLRAIVQREDLSELHEAAHDALHEWLEGTLEEVDDWVAYTSHLSDGDGIDLALDWELARRFESFADSDLDYRSSYSQDVDELRSLAVDFDLDDLTERIDYLLDEWESEDDHDYDRHEGLSGPEELSSSEIAALFGRLGD